MPIHAIQTNFTGGEQSPRTRYRIDVDKHNNGCKAIKNCIPYIHGSARSTYGRRLASSELTGSVGNIKLFPFKYSETDALMLQLSASIVRFFDQNGDVVESGGSEYQITTLPYNDDEIAEVNIKARKNTILLFHPSHPIQRLRRYSNTEWVHDAYPLDPAPFFEIGHNPSTTITLSGITGSGITVTAGASAFLAGDVGRFITAGTGTLEITAFTSATVVTCDVVNDFDALSYVADLWTIEGSPQVTATPSESGNVAVVDTTVDAFRSDDLGNLIRINGGVYRITSVNSAQQVGATIVDNVTSTALAIVNSWSIEQPIYSSRLGYPRDGDFFQQRLILAGSPGFPNSFAVSRVGLFNDFTPSLLDDDGFFYELDTNSNDPVLHIGRRKKDLMLLTSAEEIRIGPNADGLFTPTRFEIEFISEYGSSGVPPIRAASDFIYAQAGGRKIRATRYDFDSDEFDSTDLLKLNEHITEGGIVAMAFQREPDNLIWLALADGTAVAIAFDTQERVISPAQQISSGEIVDIATMDAADGSTQVWFVVRRDIGGFNALSQLEIEDKTLPSIDAATVITSGVDVTSWSLPTALRGETVSVRLDGVIQKDIVVAADDTITTETAGKKVEAGLAMPAAEIKLWPPTINDDSGSTIGQKQVVVNSTIGLLDSGAIKVKGQLIGSNQWGSDILDQSPVPLSGDFTYPGGGYEINEDFDIVAATIEPVHVLGVVRNVKVNQSDR